MCSKQRAARPRHTRDACERFEHVWKEHVASHHGHQRGPGHGRRAHPGKIASSFAPLGGHEHSKDRFSRTRPLRLLYGDRKSTRLNSSHTVISYAVFCLKKKKKKNRKSRKLPTVTGNRGPDAKGEHVLVIEHVTVTPKHQDE